MSSLPESLSESILFIERIQVQVCSRSIPNVQKFTTWKLMHHVINYHHCMHYHHVLCTYMYVLRGRCIQCHAVHQVNKAKARAAVMVVLKNIPRILSPQLLSVLARMGHGDEIGP